MMHACPKCRTDRAVADFLNVNGKERPWCRECRDAYAETMRALGKGRAPKKSLGTPLEALITTARQAGAQKATALLLPNGLRKQKAWRLHYALEKRLEKLTKDFEGKKA
jgi:transposase-like protein